MNFKTIFAELVLVAMQATTHAAPAAQATPIGTLTGDPTRLVGTTVTLPALPENSDRNL